MTKPKNKKQQIDQNKIKQNNKKRPKKNKKHQDKPKKRQNNKKKTSLFYF